MKCPRLLLSFAVVALGIGFGWSVSVPLHADSPPAGRPATVVDTGEAPLDRMIADLKVIAELVKQLDDAKFETRQQAGERLIKLGRPAIEPLKRVLEARPNLEMTNRINGILAAIRKKDKVLVFAKTAEILAKLSKPIDLDQGLGPNVTLADALEFLQGRYDLMFIVDSNAFNAIGVAKAEETPVSLPKMSGVTLGSVLGMICSQVKGDRYMGGYLVRDGRVEVTTTYHNNLENLNNAQATPRVHTDFDETPLEDALRELANLTGVSLMIDKRIANKAKETVSATLNGVPVDTAARLLADMAGLKVLIMDNVLYVTTRENAKELEADHEKRRLQRKEGNPFGAPPAM